MSLPPNASYYNDPDQLLIGNNGLSYTEAEVQMGMWALWSAPMNLSVEVSRQASPGLACPLPSDVPHTHPSRPLYL